MLPHLGDWWKTMWDCFPTTSSSHPFVKMSLQSCCICVYCEVSTIAIVYSPVCCGCSMCIHLARVEISILKPFFPCAWYLVLQIHKFLPTMLLGFTAPAWRDLRMGVGHEAASALSLRMNKHLEMEGQDQKSTQHRGHMQHSSSSQQEFVRQQAS